MIDRSHESHTTTMGTRFLDSILALVTAVAVVFAAYLAGYALSADHAAWAWIAAAGLLGGGLVLGWLTARRFRRHARNEGEQRHR